MLENEKKVTELNEEELNDVVGGFVRPGQSNMTFTECPCCGFKFEKTLNSYYRCPSCKEECGDWSKWGRKKN